MGQESPVGGRPRRGFFLFDHKEFNFLWRRVALRTGIVAATGICESII